MEPQRAARVKRIAKIAIDLVMLALLVYVVLYRAGMGLMPHAQAGVAVLALFIVHHAINRRWFARLRRGSYGPRRIVLTAVNALLLACVIGMLWSALMMSAYVFPFAPFAPTQTAADVHRMCAWGTLGLSVVHALLHVRLPRSMRKQRSRSEAR